MKKFIKKINNQEGYIALIAILIIVAVTLAVGISMSLLGIGQTQASFTEQQSRQSFHLADGCLEDAILKIKIDDYIGIYNLNLNEGSCMIEVWRKRTSCVTDVTTIPDSPNYRTIKIQSNVNNLIRNITAEMNLTGGGFVLSCWKEM